MKPAYFEFQNAVKLLCGQNALERIPDELRHLEAERPMLLTDAVLLRLGLVDEVQATMRAEGCAPVTIFSDIPVDSSLGVVNRIAALYREFGCDSMVAVGGGSVIDSAKGARMMLSRDTDDILAVSGIENLRCGRHIPFIVVPTTAGTGSECTGVAVIRNEEQGVKMEFLSPFVEPDVAVLDARMTLRLPARATASTGVDALCHAIEAATCLQSNPLSSAYCHAAIRLIFANMTKAVQHGADAEARLNMAMAATMAGIAFSNSMVGAVHAIGHALGGVCHVPHGEAMGILMPHVMRYNLPAAAEGYARLLPEMVGWEKAASIPAQMRGEAMVQAVTDLLGQLHASAGIPLRLSEAGVEEQQLPRVAETAVNDGALIVNPRAMSVQQVLELLRGAL